MSSSRRHFILKTFVFCFILSSLFLGLFFLKKVNADNLPSSVHVFITLCGNNIKETGEECDGSDLNQQTCVTRGFTTGTLGCNTNCTFNTSNCSTGGGGGGGTYVMPTAVVLQGWAYPNSDVEIIKDGNVVTIVRADNSANFKATINNITAGIWTFGVSAIDQRGHYSNTFSFTMNVQENMITTVSNIFLPPTISLDKDRVNQGDPIGVLGQTTPNNDISLYVYSNQPIIKTVKSDLMGAYFYNLDTTSLAIGDHFIKGQGGKGAQFLGGFSASVDFYIYAPGTIIPPDASINGPSSIQADGCMKVNLNCDLATSARLGQAPFKQDVVNFVDASILLYNWGIPKNTRADLNNDGAVNYQDLSILLYYWTG